MTNHIKKAARSVGADERPASQDAQGPINFNSSITKEPRVCMENFSAAADKLNVVDGETLMELRGVRYDSHRSNGQLLVDVFYISDAGDVDDAGSRGPKSCVPCDPCVPVTANALLREVSV